MGRHLFNRVISRLYRSIILRVLIILFVLLYVAYYTLILPWVNRSVSEQYRQQTGHGLHHDKINLQLFKCNFSVGHLKDAANLWQADDVNINLACMQSLRERSIVINEITIRQLKATAVQQESGLWNFDDVIKHQQAIAKAAPAKSEKSAVPVIIKKLTVINSAVHSSMLALKNVSVDAAPLNFSIENIDLRNHKSSGFSLKADLNKSARISLTGQIDISSLSGTVEVNANNIPFIWFNGLLEPYVRLEVLNGAFEFHNRIDLIAGAPQKITGKGRLSDLKLRPTSMEQDAVKWKSLEWEDAEILLTEKSIHVPLVTLNELDGQFIIDKDRKTNVQAMIVTPAPASTTTIAAVGPSKKPWQFAVDRLAVNKAAIGFYDQSLVPSFTAIVQNFTGSIINISSDENTLASIDLNGNVDGYAPVTLKGKANIFRAAPKLDALLSFKQMDMGALSPYSAEYAGWKINKGLLSADLNYHYEDGKILGKNHVVIDHLEFGEKVRGTHVVDIPLRLGLAMLTDENGKAILDTEISGTPSDPQFKLRDIIVRALGNTLKKIVSSPFKFISNLLNTKEDLGKIQFTSGESQLTDTAKEKLNLLTEALKKRPNMRLSVQGTYDEKSDLVALKEEQVKSALQKSGVTLDSLKAHDEAWSKAVSEKYTGLGLADKNSVSGAEEKYLALIAAESVNPERLTRLAHERAQAVKQYFILQLGVSGETILLNSETRCEKAEQCATSEAIFTLEV
ncbi:hypothetical protein GCM10011613_14730 [Cellvibrio zantedeschiae]|uniref:DUF748 domain-containing protein n=1 Tax=Cellvibrio zantedeschiae TaxID=1237077 RepID=A0ABQ3AXU3_9GAMM|nr:hypothetical protein GCM10011613_14730 [Cellvibrio zantedeschiae]